MTERMTHKPAMKPDQRGLRMIPNPRYCERCKGRGYLVGDSEWEPYAVQCPECASYDRWKTRSPDDEQDDDPPQQWFVCDACDGSGVEVFGTWEYEPGCGFGHDSSDERACGKCNGAGGWLDDAEPDEVQP